MFSLPCDNRRWSLGWWSMSGTQIRSLARRVCRRYLPLRKQLKPSLCSTAGGTETFVRHFIIKDETGNVDCILWSDSSDKFLELLQVCGTKKNKNIFSFRKKQNKKQQTQTTNIARQSGGACWPWCAQQARRRSVQGSQDLEPVRAAHLIFERRSHSAALRRGGLPWATPDPGMDALEWSHSDGRPAYWCRGLPPGLR